MYRRQGQWQQQRGRQIALPEPGDVGQMIVRGASAFARRHKVVTGGYLLGLVVLLLVGSGTKLNYDQMREYNKIMNSIDVQAEYDASNDFWRADQAYRASKGWFTCDSLCQRNKQRMENARYRLDEIRKEGNLRMSDAKSVAGLFSEVGVGEVQDSFWAYFSRGKQFAKRQSMWDAMFMGMRSMGRDESMIEYGLKVLMQVLMNFSVGLVMALFISAACAAFAFVASYLLAMYGAAAGGVYGVLKVAEGNLRLQEGNRGRQHMHNRPHYD